MTAPLEDLRARVAELADIGALTRLVAWDQRTMMPPEGGPARAQQMATLQRIAHDLATDEQIGAWLDTLEADGAGLDDIDRDVVRLARRDYEESRRIPTELATEVARAGAEGQDAWQAARAANDFAAFAPLLRRNVALACEVARHLDPGGPPYDALLGLYDHGLTAARVGEVFGRLADELPGIVDDAVARPAVAPLDVPVAAQRAAVDRVLRRVGVTDEGWRVDVSAHPFTSWAGPRDTRVTTRYEDGQLESVLAALHEFGHGLYERQIDPALARTNLGAGTSMAMHESQSKLWENHVGRHPAFAAVIAEELTAGGFAIEPGPLHAALVAGAPLADPHRRRPGHLSAAHRPALRAGVGAHRRSARRRRPARGVQRRHAPSGRHRAARRRARRAAGRPLVGGRVRLLPVLCAGLPHRRAAVGAPGGRHRRPGRRRWRAATSRAIRDWLAEHVHRLGRRLDTEPLLER